MEEIPSIFVTDGWETDNSGKLIEVVIPAAVDMYQLPTKITFLGETLNWIPSNEATLEEFVAPNLTTINGATFFKNYTKLTSIDLPSIVTLTNSNYSLFMGCSQLATVTMNKLTSITLTQGDNGHFRGCAALTTINMPELVSLTTSGNSGIFSSCTGLIEVTFPKLTSISHAGQYGVGGAFMGCTALQTVNLPKLSSITGNSSNGGVFRNCAGLLSVNLGSVGNPVSSILANTFQYCTQSNLTITIYTTGGASLANEPWGATNATIIYEEA